VDGGLPVGPAHPPDPSQRPYNVVRSTRTFADSSRPTPAGTATPELPERTLVTEFYVPQADGPLPLVIFGHGLLGHPDKFTELLTRWAEAGYLVAAPAFPLTNSKVDGASGNARDVWQQPGDISFVLDTLLAATNSAGDPLQGKVDVTRLAAAGLSLGGATTLGLAYNACCRDARFRAFLVLAGNPIPLERAYDFSDPTPILFVHGDRDESLSIQAELDAFRRAKSPKWFVTLIGGSHAPPFEDDVTPWDAYVGHITTAFWDLKLAPVGGAPGHASPDPDAVARFETLLASAPELARPEAP